MNLFILGEHHIMRDSHWPRSVAPTTTRISGFHMVLLSKMHGCSCCSNLNPLTTIETFFFCVCKPLKLSGVSGGIPSAFPRKIVLPMYQECSASCNGAQKRTREIARYSAYGGAEKTPWVASLGHTHDLFWSIVYEYHDDCVADIQYLCILYMHITICYILLEREGERKTFVTFA